MLTTRAGAGDVSYDRQFGKTANPPQLWIVATDDPDEAMRAVKSKAALGSNLESIHDHPSDETIRRLALAPGQAGLV
jgi:hypothetical protein